MHEMVRDNLQHSEPMWCLGWEAGENEEKCQRTISGVNGESDSGGQRARNGEKRNFVRESQEELLCCLRRSGY